MYVLSDKIDSPYGTDCERKASFSNQILTVFVPRSAVHWDSVHREAVDQTRTRIVDEVSQLKTHPLSREQLRKADSVAVPHTLGAAGGGLFGGSTSS